MSKHSLKAEPAQNCLLVARAILSKAATGRKLQVKLPSMSPV